MNEIKEIFELKKKNYLVLLYDLGFVISLLLLSAFHIFIIYKLVQQKVLSIDFMSVFQGYGVELAYDGLVSFYIYFIIFTILYVLFLSLSNSFFRIRQVSLIFKKKVKNFWYYFLGNLITLPLLVGFILYFLMKHLSLDPLSSDFTLRGLYFSGFMILLFSHYSFFYTINFLKTNKIFLSIKKGFFDSIRVKIFYKPYLFLITFFSILTYIISRKPILIFLLFWVYFLIIFWTHEMVRYNYEK